MVTYNIHILIYNKEEIVMEFTQDKINQIFAEVQIKATTNESFRKALLADPKQTISKEIGTELPDSFNIKIIENDPNYNATFVLPDMISEELDEDDLDAVAGGACGIDGACGANACAANVSIGLK